MKRSMFVAAALVGLGLAAGPAHAWDNQWGGRVVSKTQLYAEGGFPHTEFGARIPVGKLELSPQFRFAYAFGVQNFGAVMLSPGLGMRLPVLDKGSWAAAFTARLPVHIVVAFGVNAGIGLFHPGFMATWQRKGVDVDIGIRFEDDLFFVGNTVSFIGAFPTVFGLTFGPGDKLSLGVKLETGPWFSATGGAVTTDLLVRGIVGIGLTL